MRFCLEKVVPFCLEEVVRFYLEEVAYVFVHILKVNKTHQTMRYNLTKIEESYFIRNVVKNDTFSMIFK